MLSKLIAFLLAIVPATAWAAVPSASITATFAASAKAPLLVYFDAAASTDADTSQPIHDLTYCFESDEVNADTYDNTTHKSTAKNTFCGAPSYAYVYEAAGTYTAQVTVIDQDNNRDTATVEITVNSFTGVNTRCVNPVGDAVFTGCPGGADQANNNDFDDAAEGGISAGFERVLFKGGSSFAISEPVNLDGTSNGGVHIAAYGTGRYTITGTADPLFQFVDDVRIEDFTWAGDIAADVFNGDNGSSSDSDDVLMRNASVSASSHVLSMGANTQAGTAFPENIGIFESTFNDCGNAGAAGNCLFTSITKVSVVDSIFFDSTDGEHVWRLQHGEVCFVHNSKFDSAAENKHSITLRGLPNDGRIGGITDAIPEQCFFSDNHFHGGTAWIIQSGGINSGVDAGKVPHNDHIYERNYFTATLTGANEVQCMLKFEAGKQTARNNVFDLTDMISAGGNALCSGVDGNEAFNNAAYGSNTNRSFWAKTRGTCTVKNNVLWNSGGTSSFFIDDTCATVATNWDSDGTTTGLETVMSDLTECPFVACPPVSVTDFAIKATDPDSLIDGGTSVPHVIDYLQLLRPAGAGFDVGAFEDGASSPLAGGPPKSLVGRGFSGVSRSN